MVYNWLKNNIAGFRNHCVLCGARSGAELACRPCVTDALLPVRRCPRCGSSDFGEARDSRLCGACLRRPPVFDQAIVLSDYVAPFSVLIKSLKYRGHFAAAQLFSDLLARRLQRAALPSAVSLLVPVPLHPRRLARRGYNQAGLLAERIARKTGLAIDHRLVARRKATRAQYGLSERERRKNLKGAFRLMRPARPEHIAMVDDIMTTGATLNEMARLFKQNGTRRVAVVVACRANLRFQ